MNQCRFLVWNICKKNKKDKLNDCLKAMEYWIDRYQLDVLVLIECLTDHAIIIKDTLTEWSLLEWEQMPTSIRKEVNLNHKNNIRIFTRKGSRYNFLEWNISGYAKYKEFSSVQLLEQITQSYQAEKTLRNASDLPIPTLKAMLNKFRFLIIEKDDKLNLGVFVHLYSKTETTTQLPNNEVVNLILNTLLEGYSNHFVAGDLNYNPFDDFLFPKSESRSSFKSLSNKKAFIVPNNNFKGYYYNPTWKLLTDFERISPFGNSPMKYTPSYSFYHNAPESGERYFNLLDGILLHQNLINRFDDSFFQLLDCYSDNCQIKHLYEDDEITPKKCLYSDHLPFIFAIRF